MSDLVKEFKKWRFWVSIVYIIGIIIAEYYLIQYRYASIIEIAPLNILLIGGIMVFYFFGALERHKLLVGKILYIGLFAIVIGSIIWLLGSSSLFLKPWSPLIYINQHLKNQMLILLLVPAFGIGAYVGFLIGEKRKWYIPILGSDNDDDEDQDLK